MTSTEPSARGYLLLWLALLALVSLALLVPRVLDGSAALAASLVIAFVKIGLVAGGFMHLAAGRALHRLVLAVGLGFVVLLVLGVVGDIAARPDGSAYVDDRGGR
jgi:caa(3)-type oxidase subunit IV